MNAIEGKRNRRNRPSPRISSRSQVRFRSGHCGDWNGMVPALLPGSLLFYFCQLIRHVCLLVFLLGSATIDGKNFDSDCYVIKRLSARGTKMKTPIETTA